MKPAARYRGGWRRTRFLLLAAILALAACGDRGAGGPEEFAVERAYESGDASLTVKASKDVITVADRLKLVLELTAPEGEAVAFPTPPEKLGEFTVIGTNDADPVLVEGARILHRRAYELDPFLPGEYEIPSLTVQIGQDRQIETAPITIQVDSVLPAAGETPDIKDIRPPLSLPGFAPWVYAVAALALAAVAFGAWWWRRRRKAEQEKPPPLPHEVALRRLRELMDEDLIAKGEWKQFYLRVSSILRYYIEDRFGLRAPERTTEEFLHDLREEQALTGPQKALLRKFLQHCDMVKFAEYTPSRAEADDTINTCAQFIAETKPKPAAGPPGVAGHAAPAGEKGG